MKKVTQRETNPFKYSDSNKRYHTFDYYVKHRFGGKCARIALDAGFSCPNKDGTKSRGGCIFCYGGSSGACGGDTLRSQYEKGVEAMQRKWKLSGFIPYLQANTNTYAPLDVLGKIYNEAAYLPGAVMLVIATRADCLGDDVVELILKMSEIIPVMVELGLQSVFDETAKRINRGHTFEEFLAGYNKLKAAGGDISVCVHLINGLPGESEEMMLQSARTVASLRPDMVKLHLLHVLYDTPLYELYISGKYETMDRDRYIETVCRQLELFHPETVIARVTGDAPEALLAAPDWCRRKTAVTNDIDKYLVEHGMYQGRLVR
ncbi:MAG: TIGR01212 family radical SAM protein [Clostridia bacterium]|nr:TIGR01212 family radical SAM protein [Clostridia bacterium]